MTVFALLDDARATAQAPTSRLYTGFVRERRCADPDTLDAFWREVEADQRAGLHAVVLADYEWGAKLLRAGQEQASAQAALRVLLFTSLRRLSAESAGDWLAARASQESAGPCGVADLTPSVTPAQFRDAIGAIHEAIAAGETYQVNFTYRLHGWAYGAPIALYRALRARQPVAYGAFIALPDGAHVLSLSPELFVRHEAGVLTARPMKGTASRIPVPEGDSENARLLSLDVKNRAENLMIVDLLRNDLGRIARTGSVKVPALFSVEPYTTVFQMTSTVQAELRPEAGMPEVLRAIFPCGSITGAPKHQTMKIIAGLESTPRGLYCGAIGWLDAPRAGARVGDFCLSVAIRTLLLDPVQPDGLRPLTMGVGAGIVKDSRADDEWEECRLKARFVTGLDPGIELFETMRREPDGCIPLLDRHLARLAASARALGFAFDEGAARAALGALPAVETPQRVRLALAHGGQRSLQAAPLEPLPEGEAGLLLAETPLPAGRALAGHKTTDRDAYDAGVRRAVAEGAFDTLFFDTAGRLIEGGRSNVFLKLDGRWVTPPLSDGVLPGVMRAVLLDDPAWAVTERTLTRTDLARAEAIVVTNALRGALPAVLRAPVAA